MEKYSILTNQGLLGYAVAFIIEVIACGGEEMHDDEVFFDSDVINSMNDSEKKKPPYHIGFNDYRFHWEYHAFRLNGYVIDIMTCFPDYDDGLIACPRDMMRPLLYNKNHPDNIFMLDNPLTFTIRIQHEATGHTLSAMSIAYENFQKAYDKVYHTLDKLASID